MKFNEQATDRGLMEKVRKGDHEAFNLIFDKYGPRLYGFALSYLKSKEETEELVQEVFLKLWKNREKLKMESSLKSYLFTIAYHDMCQVFRKEQIREKFLVEGTGSDCLAVNLEEQLEYKGTLDQVEKLLDELPSKQRIVFWKSRKEGKSSREIAREMDLTPGTVDNLISATLKFLRKHISESNFALLLLFEIFLK